MTTTSTRPARPAGSRHGTGPGGRRLRVALYSHDALGLGHVRRNLAIARTLSRLEPAPDVLLLTGAPEAVTAHRPAHCDLVSLPALAKDATGTYAARHLSVDEAHIRHMRRSILTAAVSSFRPDVLVVDKHPRGFLGELEPALDRLRGAGTRVVLGLRDVLDDADTSRREWDAARGDQALQRWYDQVWVYGDRAVHDLTAELRLPSARTVHTGYLATGRLGVPPAVTEVPSPYVLAMVGGGSDGAHLAEAVARATMPAGHHGIVVTGPQMPADDVRRVAEIAAQRTDLTVRTYVEDAEALIGGASAVVSMGGYNTVCEALALGARLLVVPRVRPREEQLVRARLLTAVGVLDHVHPDLLDPPALERWLAGAVTAPAATRGPGDLVDLDGLARLPHLLASLVATKEETDVA